MSLLTGPSKFTLTSNQTVLQTVSLKYKSNHISPLLKTLQRFTMIPRLKFNEWFDSIPPLHSHLMPPSPFAHYAPNPRPLFSPSNTLTFSPSSGPLHILGSHYLFSGIYISPKWNCKFFWWQALICVAYYSRLMLKKYLLTASKIRKG